MESRNRIRDTLRDHLKGVAESTIESLSERLGGLSLEHTLAMVDIGAGLAGSSLRAAVEFLRAAPEVAHYCDSAEMRVWGEIGRRLTVTSVDTAVEFFQVSAEVLSAIPQSFRARVLSLCNKQSSLSAGVALESFKSIAEIVNRLEAEGGADAVLTACHEIARHSVKHSSDLLQRAPEITAHLRRIDPTRHLTHRALKLTLDFAHRSGGTAAEFFMSLPETVIVSEQSFYDRLFDHTTVFLDRGGSVALQYFKAAGSVLNSAGQEAFQRWTTLSFNVASQGNAASYHFLKASPRIIAELAACARADRVSELVNGVLQIVNEISQQNSAASIECFKASPRALRAASLPQFRQWAMRGLELYSESPRRAQAYYALESKGSQESLQGIEGGLTLESVAHILRLYVEGLTGREFTIAPMTNIPDEARIGDGRTIHLPSVVAEFEADEANFRLYKVLAAHSAGQVEFGTHAVDTTELRAAMSEVRAALNGRTWPCRGRESTQKKAQASQLLNYSSALSLFPYPALAARIFATLENARIDRMLRYTYRGIRRDLDFVRDQLRKERPPIQNVPAGMLPFELLFQVALCGGATEEARRSYGHIVSRLEEVIENYLSPPRATVADTILATYKVYEMFDHRPPEQNKSDSSPENTEQAEDEGASTATDGDQSGEPQIDQNAQDPLSFWAVQMMQGNENETQWRAALLQHIETPEQELESGDKVYYYDEWDRELGDYRTAWCRVIERRGHPGSRSFVEKVRASYSGIISSIRHQFQLMRLESLRKVFGELDGEDFDLQAVIDYALDRRTTGRVSERLYVRKMRRERDVAVTFLLDMSSSTARTISRHPNQPYTKPGQRIIDIEKEGLVLMSEALEAVGDAYAMYGFTSEGRRNVKFYVFKDFADSYSVDVEKRIGGITYQNNTRLGAAIRHAAARLSQQDSRTKLLIILSDGRPYDHDYGDSRYAREDTKMALRQAKIAGITPFCITIDRESEDQLRDMYGEVGYTIIDNVLSLPERLPGIYRRLTT